MTLPSLEGSDLLSHPAFVAVADAFEAAGEEIRLAGGPVRDALLSEPVSDFDCATPAVPRRVIEIAEKAGLKSVPTGIDHGTVTLISDGTPVEVTTLRKDTETDGRRAVVAFTDDWTEDASRRDFTMNALYAERNGTVHDPVNGYPDLLDGKVRFVGDADRRIREDYLRVLRFFRFFARFGEGRPDADTLKAIVRNRDNLSILSAERVWSELKRLFGAKDPSRSVLWMRTAGVLTKVLPESEKWGIDALPRVVRCGAVYGWAPDGILRLMAVLPPNKSTLTGLAERLKLSKAEKERLLSWAGTPDADPDEGFDLLAQRLYWHGTGPVLDRLRLKAAQLLEHEDDRLDHTAGLIEQTKNWQRPAFPLTGKDLIAMGAKPGPELGDRLRKLEEEWVKRGFRLAQQNPPSDPAPPGDDNGI